MVTYSFPFVNTLSFPQLFMFIFLFAHKYTCTNICFYWFFSTWFEHFVCHLSMEHRKNIFLRNRELYLLQWFIGQFVLFQSKSSRFFRRMIVFSRRFCYTDHQSFKRGAWFCAITLSFFCFCFPFCLSVHQPNPFRSPKWPPPRMQLPSLPI